jgi:hypothetical protein
MPKFMITYDLRGVRDYDAVYKKLDAWKAVSLLDSVWLVSLNGTADAVANALRKVSDFDDGLAVIELKAGDPTGDWATFAVPDEAVAWLRKHVAS